jgi:hypothetical protein
MIDGAAGTVSTVAQGLIAALGQFVNQDTAANAEKARANIDQTNQNISDFGNELVEGRIAIQTALSTLESALLASASGLIDMSIKSQFSLAEGLTDIIEGAQIGDIDQIMAGMVTVIGESIIPGAGDAGTSIFDRMFGNFGDRANIVTPRNERALDNNFLGGNVQAGDFSMVGERGPELVRFGSNGEVINNATTQDIMGAANQVANNIGNNNNNIDYSQQTLDVLTTMAREQSDTKRLLQKILPKAMASNGYF